MITTWRAVITTLRAVITTCRAVITTWSAVITTCRVRRWQLYWAFPQFIKEFDNGKHDHAYLRTVHLAWRAAFLSTYSGVLHAMSIIRQSCSLLDSQSTEYNIPRTKRNHHSSSLEQNKMSVHMNNVSVHKNECIFNNCKKLRKDIYMLIILCRPAWIMRTSS